MNIWTSEERLHRQLFQLATEDFQCLQLVPRSRLRQTVALGLYTEMGIYRDNLSAIFIGDKLLPIIVIA